MIRPRSVQAGSPPSRWQSRRLSASISAGSSSALQPPVGVQPAARVRPQVRPQRARSRAARRALGRRRGRPRRREPARRRACPARGALARQRRREHLLAPPPRRRGEPAPARARRRPRGSWPGRGASASAARRRGRGWRAPPRPGRAGPRARARAYQATWASGDSRSSRDRAVGVDELRRPAQGTGAAVRAARSCGERRLVRRLSSAAPALGSGSAPGGRRSSARSAPDERARLAAGAGEVALVDRRAVEQRRAPRLALRLREPGDEPRQLPGSRSSTSRPRSTTRCGRPCGSV